MIWLMNTHKSAHLNNLYKNWIAFFIKYVLKYLTYIAITIKLYVQSTKWTENEYSYQYIIINTSAHLQHYTFQIFTSVVTEVKVILIRLPRRKAKAGTHAHLSESATFYLITFRQGNRMWAFMWLGCERGKGKRG